jgi:hypothetical protein
VDARLEAVSKRTKTRSQRVSGSWYDAEIVWKRDAKGNLTAQVGAVRYKRRSLRYWRAWALAVATTIVRKVKR